MPAARSPGGKDAEDYLPLSGPALHILMALVNQERHGYAIMREVTERSEGTIRLGAGTLYGALKRMLADGLVEESGEAVDPELDDERRRYYRITSLGRAVARAEARRLAALVRVARSKRLIGPELA